MDCENHVEKILSTKSKKSVKNQSNIAACEKKLQARKRFFVVQTPLSHSTLKIEQKNHAAKPLTFWLHFLFRRDQNH